MCSEIGFEHHVVQVVNSVCTDHEIPLLVVSLKNVCSKLREYDLFRVQHCLTERNLMYCNITDWWCNIDAVEFYAGGSEIGIYPRFWLA
jgi:hypothetical protein